MTLGEKIRDIRMKRGLTQADLGGDLVTPSMISQIEADRAKPSYMLLNEIANRLGMPVEYFMNDMDHQFLFSAQMSMAMYHTATNHPDEAFTYLNAIEDAPDQGLNHQEYVLTMAQVHRQQKRYSEAIAQLEHLREIGYRMQDYRLLFHVSRESGYVEYETGNTEGAIHEWEQAVDFAEHAFVDEPSTRIDLIVLVIEVLLQLDSVTTTELDASKRPYLMKARTLTSETPDLRSASDQLIEEAAHYLHTDTSRAKLLAERANTLLSYARLVEQVVVVETRWNATEHTDADDPWKEAVKTLTAIYPDVFLSSECEQIEKLMREGDVARAEYRIIRSLQVLRGLPSGREDELRRIGWRLTLLQGQALMLHGNFDDSAAKLEALIAEIPDEVAADIKTKAFAMLVMIYGQLQDVEKTVEYCQAMESLLAKKSEPTLFA